MQAGLRRNDGEGNGHIPAVIPAKAGIQEGDDAVPQETMIQ